MNYDYSTRTLQNEQLNVLENIDSNLTVINGLIALVAFILVLKLVISFVRGCF